MTLDLIFFLLLAVIAIATALGIKRKSPEPKDEASARNG